MSTKKDKPPQVLAQRVRRRTGELVERAQSTRVVRAVVRYMIATGGLLAGGVTVTALVSITAALTLLVNLSRGMLRDRPDLYQGLLELTNDVLPGVFQIEGEQGILDPSILLISTGFNWATFVASVVLVWNALTAMTGLRKAIRAMFGLGGAPLTFFYGKLTDFIGFLALGMSLLLSSGLASAVFVGGEYFLAWLGLENPFTIRLISVLAVAVAAILDALVVLMLLRLIARIRAPGRDLLHGAILGALIFGLLRFGGTSLVAAVANPLLAPVAAVVTLVLWVNFAVRGLLLVAAWTSNPPWANIPVEPTTVHSKETPNYVTLSAPHTLEWDHHPVTGALQPGPYDSPESASAPTLPWRRLWNRSPFGADSGGDDEELDEIERDPA